MNRLLLIALLASSICEAENARAKRGRTGPPGSAANQVEKLRSQMESNDGFLRADTLVEQDAALHPDKFKQRFSDAESLKALAALQEEI